MKKLGIKRIHTTAFHPQANGQIERWHRTLKAALMARGAAARWSEELPTVLLGLRNALRGDNNTSPAQLTYGAQLRLPADFFVPSKPKIEETDFVRCLTETMATLSPAQNTVRSSCRPFVHKNLQKCTHVFIRNDTVRSPLTPPYDGPYPVLQRHDKYYKIQLPTRVTVVSLDRLKPAYICRAELHEEEGEEEDEPSHTSPKPMTDVPARPPHRQTDSAPAPPQSSPHVRVTRSGRISKPTVRFT